MSYTENHPQHQCKRIPGLTNLPKEIFLWVFKWIVGKKQHSQLSVVKCILQAWVMKHLYMNHSPVPYTGLKSGLLGIKVVVVRTFLCTCVCKVYMQWCIAKQSALWCPWLPWGWSTHRDDRTNHNATLFSFYWSLCLVVCCVCGKDKDRDCCAIMPLAYLFISLCLLLIVF